jgi:acyl-coenzyme A thioesterase PaaI-like protein
MTIDELQDLIAPQFPGLLGMQFTELTPTRVVATLRIIGGAKVNTVVTGESLALHRGRTTMVWQTSIRNDQGKLCSVVTQTQLVLD